MYKEAKNLKPGDRVTWTAEFLLEVTTAPKIDQSGCQLSVRIAGAEPVQKDESGNQTILLSSPKTRLVYLGNIADIEQQIRQLTEQKAALQGTPLPEERGKQLTESTGRDQSLR